MRLCKKDSVMRVEKNRITIWDHTKAHYAEFGFKVDVPIKHAERLGWPYEDLLDCLRHGIDYACDETQPFSTFSPHYP